MDGSSGHCTEGNNQNQSKKTKMQGGKLVVWGGFINSWGKKTSERQGRKGKIYPTEYRVPENSKEIRKKVKVNVTQSCQTLCDPMDYTVHGILQARILEWVAFPFSSGSSWPRNRTGVSSIAGRFFTNWAMTEARGEIRMLLKWTMQRNRGEKNTMRRTRDLFKKIWSIKGTRMGTIKDRNGKALTEAEEIKKSWQGYIEGQKRS